MRALSTSCLLLSAFVLGCSGSSESTNDGSTSGGGSAPVKNPDDMMFDTGEFQVPAGESLTCFYLDAKTSKEMSVTGGVAQQGPGGHHIVIYWTDTPRSPEHHPCTDQEMLSWHQFAADAEGSKTGAEGIITLPDGLATRVPEGKQLVIQSHYIVTSGHSEMVDDKFTIHTIEASKVKAYVNYFAMVDDGFEVPPNGSLKRATTCTTPQQLDNVLLLGHMHEFGTHYKLETVDDGGSTGKTLYDTAWQPAYVTHPPIDHFPMDKPFSLPKGTRLQQTCEWANTTHDPLTFPREMCLAYFYYFPDNGELSCESTLVQ